MLSEIKVRTLKANQAPGTLLYTGDNTPAVKPLLRVMHYSQGGFQEKTDSNLSEDLITPSEGALTWIQLEGLQNIPLMEQLAAYYNLHPLTVEDILNVEQRPKIEEFDNYIFITLKALKLSKNKKSFNSRNLSIVLGKDFLLSFQDEQSSMFDSIRDRIGRHPEHWTKKKGSDYLGYRLLDTVVDQYFFVLEEIGDQIEKIEKKIITNPTKRLARVLYRLKNKMLIIRKVIWPLREVLNHLLNVEQDFVTSSTKLYLRDVHDHASQAMDVVETFREMLSNMLDVYLSNLTYRMNEIMKVLTIITTIFIPITFIASIYGMNFEYMPELHVKWAYPVIIILMVVVAGLMLYYYRRKKWL